MRAQFFHFITILTESWLYFFLVLIHVACHEEPLCLCVATVLFPMVFLQKKAKGCCIVNNTAKETLFKKKKNDIEKNTNKQLYLC